MKVTTKVIHEYLDTSITPELEKLGYIRYQGKSFIKIENDILFYIKVFHEKKNPNIWFTYYPLIMKSIWFGASTKTTSGRVPNTEGEFSISDEQSLKNCISGLIGLIPEIINFFHKNNSTNSILNNISDNDLIFPKLVKAYCLCNQNLTTDATKILLLFQESNMGNDNEKKGVVDLLNAIENGSFQEELQKNKYENIKKLKLSRFINKKP